MKLWLWTCIVFLSACQMTQHKSLYVPPMGERAAHCLEACEQELQACEDARIEKYNACRQDKLFEERIYENCVQARGVIGQQGSCNPPALCPLPDVRQCTQSFDRCYESCGGSVIPQ